MGNQNKKNYSDGDDGVRWDCSCWRMGAMQEANEVVIFKPSSGEPIKVPLNMAVFLKRLMMLSVLDTKKNWYLKFQCLCRQQH